MTFHFDRDISRLKKEAFNFFRSVEKTFSLAIDCIKNKDVSLAKKIIKEDEKIDAMELYLEEECLKILALNQPVAKDLRLLITFIKLTNDLERIADIAVNIAKSNLSLIDQTKNLPDKIISISSPFDIDKMAKITLKMVRKGFKALNEMDLKIAKEVIKQDKSLNKLHSENYFKISKYTADHMPQSKRQEHIFANLIYLSVSKQLERIGDLMTNIAEDTYYIVTGTIIRHRKI